MRKLAVTGTLAFVALFSSSFLFAADERSGESLYSINCASCHGADGSSQTATGKKFTAPDLRVALKSRTDKSVADSIGKGVGHSQYPHSYEMRGMSRDSVLSIVLYLRTLGNKK